MKRIFKHINRFEKQHYPKIRRKNWYLCIKLIVLLPLVIIAQIQHTFQRLQSKRKGGLKLRRKDKSPIVLANIVSGFTNLTFPNEAIEKLAHKRASICADCPAAEKVGVYSIIVDNRTKNIQGMRCSDCGCNLSAKVRSERDYCPRGKW